ncbi:response regulator transcription factor [Sporofaciens musculi]|uniref:response regulator transcription factor n=1 Tax=Sporofaciens musculi TaxID=2681861 RepID=UPI0025709B94|nr:response regulator transcription factor [Sporofaciens musculi]
MTEIYYIEDDENIAGMVKEYLVKKGYSVSVFRTLQEGKRGFMRQVPELALVDWNLPDGKGNDLLRWIRSRWVEVPVIFLTVRNDTCDIVAGFEEGADDYVVKPFELEVLYSRVRALLRRTREVSGRYLSCGSISLDKKAMAVFYQGEEISVSQAEYQILLLLMTNKGKTVTRESLLLQVWDKNGNYVNDNTLTVVIKRLREKLHQPSCLKTIRSFGYRMEEDAWIQE